MTPFEQQNHYEVLDIFPEATPYEVREAYKTALKLYDDPMATYSLFSEDEKTQILCRIEEAFLTLISQESRPRYDRMLVRLGRTEENSLHKGSSKEPIPLFDLKSSRAATSSASIIRPKPTSARPARQSVVDEILARKVLSGNDLRRIRIELGISLADIAHQTKIRPDSLRSIEQDQFDNLPSRLHLRSFLKSYIQCLHLDPQTVAAKYISRIEP